MEIKNIDKIILDSLKKRGLSEDEIHSLVNHDMKLFDPFLLKNMKKTCERIFQAKMNKEKIIIFGDYDVDGSMAATILIDFLKKIKFEVDYYIPKREEGYGFSIAAIKKFIDNDVKLIISVDTGITAIKEINYAQENGVDVIITDHHLLGKEVPKAYAIINPLQKGCKSPFKKLSGGGLSLFLVRALNYYSHKKHNTKKENLDDYYIYAMFSTIADVVDLYQDNRVIVKYGLSILDKSNNPAIKSLMKLKNFYNKPSSLDIAFQVTPIINAAGRLENASLILKAFLEKDIDKAHEKMKELLFLNEKRKEITKDSMADIIDEAKESEDKVIVIAKESIHEGITGILAARVSEETNKPALVISIGEKSSKGSARTGGYNIKALMDLSDNLFLNFGGHPNAAGFSIEKNKINKLRKELNKNYKDEVKVLEKYDFELKENFIDENMLRSLKTFEPYGKGIQPFKIKIDLNWDDFHIRYLKKEHILLNSKKDNLKILIFYYKKFNPNLEEKKISLIGDVSVERNDIKVLTSSIEILEK